MKPGNLKITFVGAGNTCKVLGTLLKKRGHKVAIASRSLKSAREASKFIGAGIFSDKPEIFTKDSDVIFITTSDDAIETVINSLAKNNGFRKDAIIIHCSGNYPSKILKVSPAISVASIHPLRSLANPSVVARDFKGTFYAYEGDKKAISTVEKIIKDIGGIPLRVKTGKKPLYHIGAVFASNYLVSIFEIALRLFERCGIPRGKATPALLKLSKGTMANIEKVGIPKALTGPIERGDMKTINYHLSTLKDNRIIKLYKALGKVVIDIAVSKNSITKRKAAFLRKLLSR